jgi:hypothetical protein
VYIRDSEIVVEKVHPIMVVLCKDCKFYIQGKTLLLFNNDSQSRCRKSENILIDRIDPVNGGNVRRRKTISKCKLFRWDMNETFCGTKARYFEGK